MVEIDKNIQVEDGYFFTEKKAGEVQIKMCDKNGNPLIAMLYYFLLEPDFCYQLLFIVLLIN